MVSGRQGRDPRETETQPPVGSDRNRTGDVVGGWLLQERLGRGAMGSVYRASREGRVAAVKLLASGLDSPSGDRFRRESALLRRLDHPAIVKVFDDGIDAGVGFFAMELAEGPSLQTRLERGPLAPDATREVFRRVFEALAHAHARGVVHRDLKPANIVITADGATLVDFGIARDTSATRLTRTESVVGTFSYMSPEQRAGGDADSRSDLFSCGVMLYEALTGRIPVGAYEPPSRHVPALPPGLDRFVETLLQADPSRRIASAIDAARELDRAFEPTRRRLPRRLAATLIVTGSIVTAGTFSVVRILGTPSDQWESSGGPGTGRDNLGIESILVASNGVLYAATTRGPYKLAASCAAGAGPGDTWCLISSGLEGVNPTTFLDAGDHILVATNGSRPFGHGKGVFIMRTQEEVWRPAGEGGPQDSFSLTALEGIFAGDGNFCTGVHRLRVPGEPWEDVSTGLDPDRSSRRDRCVNDLATDGEYLYAASGLSGVFRSNRTHAGWNADTIRWSPLPPGLPDGNVVSLHRPVRGGPLLAGTNHCGLWSWAAESGWKFLGAPAPMIQSILVKEEGLLAGGSDLRLAFSPDPRASGPRAWYDLTEGLPIGGNPRGPDATIGSIAASGDACYTAVGGVVFRRDCSARALRRAQRGSPIQAELAADCILPNPLL